MGISEPSSVQKLAISHILTGQDAAVAAQTGTGKTLAYLLPIIQQLVRDEKEGVAQVRASRPRALVIVPSRELASQVVAVAKSLCHHPDARFRAAVVTGGSSKHQQAQALAGSMSRKVRQARARALKELKVDRAKRVKALVKQLRGADASLDRRTAYERAEATVLEQDKASSFENQIQEAMRLYKACLSPSGEIEVQGAAQPSSSSSSSSDAVAPYHNVDLLVGTPGRLRQLLEASTVYFSDVRYLVFDEADFMMRPNSGFDEDLAAAILPIRKRLENLYEVQHGERPASGFPVPAKRPPAGKGAAGKGAADKSAAAAPYKAPFNTQIVWVGASIENQFLTEAKRLLPLYGESAHPRKLTMLKDPSSHTLPSKLKLVRICRCCVCVYVNFRFCCA